MRTEGTGARAVLDVGCGRNKTPGAIGIDRNPDSQADVTHDLDVFPYPFEDDEFDEVLCNQVLEHLADVFAAMEEIHRISKPGALVKIWVPHFSSCDAFGDPSHRHFFSARSFDYFTGDCPELSYYSRARFAKDKTRIDFWKIHKLGGLRIQSLLGAGLLANHLTTVYERFFAFVLPAQTLYFELRVVKDTAASRPERPRP